MHAMTSASGDAVQARQPTERLREQGVRVIQMEMPDINGAVRGKIASMHKGLGADRHRDQHADHVVPRRRGDHDLAVERLRQRLPEDSPPCPTWTPSSSCPWRPETAAVLCDFVMDDGSPCDMDGREILRRAVADLAELG